MASRSSALQRAITYFREAPYDEARVAFQLAKEAMDLRTLQEKSSAKAQAKAADASRPKRKRRTKAEMAEAKAQPQQSLPGSGYPSHSEA